MIRARTTLRAVLVFSTTLLLSGCGPEELRWREQVELSDGRVIIVDRSRVNEHRNAIGGPAQTFTLAEVVEANSPAGLFSRFEAPILLQRLDIDAATGRFVLIGSIGDCRAWRKVGRPADMTAQFEYSEGHWNLVPLSATWIGREANVIVPAEAVDEIRAGSLVTAEVRSRWNTSPPLFSALLSVKRQPETCTARNW
jgi:hypothetical protein